MNAVKNYSSKSDTIKRIEGRICDKFDFNYGELKNMGFDISSYPCAYDYFSREISLPLHNNLSDEDVEYVICCFEEIVRKYIKED